MSDSSNNTQDKAAAATLIKGLLAKKEKVSEVDPLTNETLEDLRQDRTLKKTYANWFIWILIGQLVVMNVVFILSGSSVLKFEKWQLDLYMGGTLLEVFGIVTVITKNLFPQKNGFGKKNS